MAVVNEYNSTYKGVINDYQLDISSTTFIGLTDGVIKATSGILSGSSTTSDLPEGTNLYFTNSRFDTRFGTKSTTDLIEGLNLYYTDGRFDTRFALKTTTNLAEGSNLYYTDARSRAALSATGSYLSYNSTSGLITSSITDSIIRGLFSAGSGISYDSSTGVITNTLAGGTVTSITGTANQVLANGTSGSAQTGAITLTLPQSIATSSAVTFGDLTIGTGSTNAELARINANNQAWFAFYTSGLRGGFFGTDTSGGGLLCYADNTSLKLRTGSGPILFYPGSASTESARITDTGLMGVGESSPDLKFVSRNTGTTAQISARYNGTAPANYKELQLGYNGASGNGYGWIQSIANGVAYTPLSLQLNGGNVGIGTSSPDRKLVIQGIGATRDPLLYLKQTNDYGYSFNVDSSSSGLLSVVGVNLGSETVPILSLDRTTAALGLGAAPTTTGGYATRLDINNGGSGPCLKLQESTGSGRGHIQIGASSTAANNIHIGCEGNGSFYVWNGNWGVGTQKFQIGSTGNFRFDNNTGYSDDAIYGVGGSYLTLFNTNSGGYSSQIGHDGTTMYINTGAGGNMYLQTFSAGYAALSGRMMLDQGGQLSFNSMTADATINILGTSAKPLAGIALGGYGYDASPYHRLELANGGGSYIYYMSQNIKWSAPNNRWEFVNSGGWGGYGSLWNFYGNGNCAFATATNSAGLPSFKTNLDLTNDGNCTMYYNLKVSGYVSRGSGIVGALSDVSTAFATTTSYAKLTTLATSRLASNTTVSTANNRITVLLAGSYKMSYAGDIYQTSGGDRTVSVVFYKNGSVYSSAAFASTCESGKYAAIVGCDVASLAVNDYIEVWVKIDTNTTVTYNAMMFIVEQI